MARAAGLSVRLKLTLSYAALVMITGTALLTGVWVFLLRYVPDRAMLVNAENDLNGVFPVRSALLREFAPKAALILGLLLLIGLVGGWILAGRVLAPLTRITDATRLAATGSLVHRIQLPGRHDELRELADAFDGMLARLEAHVAEHQRFAANASHELRTPLAITQTLLEVARRNPQPDLADLLDRLSGLNSRAVDLTEALLLLSRADGQAFVREQVDLSLIAEEAVETHLSLAEERRLRIDTTGESAVVVGSQALLLQLIMNLVHNAIVHNRPGEGTISLATTASANTVSLSVENTGDPLDPEVVDKLVEPFMRGNERLSTERAGVGLGLAIVKSITEAHGGTLTLAPRVEGGLRVTVQLPSAPGGAATR